MVIALLSSTSVPNSLFQPFNFIQPGSLRALCGDDDSRRWWERSAGRFSLSLTALLKITEQSWNTLTKASQSSTLILEKPQSDWNWNTPAMTAKQANWLLWYYLHERCGWRVDSRMEENMHWFMDFQALLGKDRFSENGF